MGKNNKYAQCNYLHTDQVVAVSGAAIGKRWCDDLLKMVFTIHTHTHTHAYKHLQPFRLHFVSEQHPLFLWLLHLCLFSTLNSLCCITNNWLRLRACALDRVATGAIWLLSITRFKHLVAPFLVSVCLLFFRYFYTNIFYIHFFNILFISWTGC